MNIGPGSGCHGFTGQDILVLVLLLHDDKNITRENLCLR